MNRFYVFCILFLQFTWSYGQLTSITPNTANHGQVLQTTITGNGIFLQSSSPCGNIFSVKLTRGLDVIEAFQYDNGTSGLGLIEVINADTTELNLTIPITVMDGLYDLEVITGDPIDPFLSHTTYSLPSSYTILPPDGYITGNVYDDLNKNGIKDGGEPGIPGQKIKLMANNVECITDINGNYRFAVANGNYTVEYVHSITDYRFLTSANSTYFLSINNNNSAGNDFGLKTALISVAPNTGYQGIALTHTLVADEPIFIPGTYPNGNIMYIHVMANPVCNAYAIEIIDSVTAKFTVTIPVGTTNGGNIDIQVYTNYGFTGTHMLKQQFNVATAPSLITGNVYNDVDKDGVKDAGEPGIQFLTVRSILTGISSDYTDFSGNYSMPAINGNFALTFEPISSDFMFATTGDTISGSVNNGTSSANNLGLKRTLVSITPNVGYKGMTTTHQIVADEPILAGAVIYGLYVFTSPSYIYVPGGTVIDSFTIQVNIPVPANATIANNLNISVSVGPGSTKFIS